MEPAACNKRFAPLLHLTTLALVVLYLLLVAAPLKGYSVLAHQALVDAAWEPFIIPLLLARYPNATQAQLQGAHAFAYGGCAIQDMGYYPLGNKFFSELTHYARAGDFVEALLSDSRNINEYAFALGALSHYVADNVGHPLAVNVSVPQMYPKLRHEYGNRVTYEDNPTAHIMTEFSFDVVQITGAGYLPKTYHNFIGFNVPRSLLNRAFEDTYGLKVNNLFWSEGLSIWFYKISASEIIPDLGQVLWRHKRTKLYRVDPQIVTSRFAYRLSVQNYRRQARRGRRARRLEPWTWRWRATAEHANASLVSRSFVFIIEVLPKVGPLRTLQFKPPIVPVQDLFIKGFDVTVARYESDVSALHEHSLVLPEENLDTGKPLEPGQYFLADQTYARLLNSLAKHHFRGLTPELRQDILAFYSKQSAPIATKQHPRKWRRTLRELAALKSASVQTQIAYHQDEISK
jgi:Zinc dependent phospholipase C